MLCPDIYPSQPRSIRPICEILLLQDPKIVPDSCYVMHIQVNTSIFHKLKYKNEWIYTTDSKTIFITCDGDKQSYTHNLKGEGRLSFNETCKGYATRDILIPKKVINHGDYTDFIPKSTI